MKVFIVLFSVFFAISCVADCGLSGLAGDYSNAIASVSLDDDGTGVLLGANGISNFVWYESERGKTFVRGFASVDGWVIIYKQYDDYVLYFGEYGKMIRD